MSEQEKQNKTTLISGGYGDIGYACARKMLELGNKVCIFGRNSTLLNIPENDNLLCLKGDVRFPSEIRTVVEVCYEKFGAIDNVLICAGVSAPTPVLRADNKIVDDLIDINLKGAYYTVSEVVPFLSKKSSIILLSSIGANLGTKGFAMYNATKAALIGLAKSFAAELATNETRVNVILPGLVQTKMHQQLGITPQNIIDFAKRLPCKRPGFPEDIANAVSFLFSDDSSYINGTEIIIDGGTSSILNV